MYSIFITLFYFLSFLLLCSLFVRFSHIHLLFHISIAVFRSYFIIFAFQYIFMKITSHYFKYYFLILSASLFFSCSDNTEKAPDTSAIKINYRSYRFDKDLYALDTNNIGSGLTQLKAKYPSFLNYFLDTLMAYEIYGNYSDTLIGVREGLKPFITFKDYKDLQDSIEKHYPDTKGVDEHLSEAFKRLKLYMPESPVPAIMYLNLGLSKWPSFPVDSNTHCIALDMFLGDYFPHYASVGAPQYLYMHRREAYIPVSVFSAIYRGDHPWDPQEKSLLELMIDKGIEQYYLHKLLVGTPDSVLFGFSKTNIDWCNANEAMVYNFFVQNKLLYSKVAMDIMSYVTDGPFARGLEPVSNPVKLTPGNIGTWMGYKIVASYMAQNPNVTLKDLISQKQDAVQILEMARYKPR